MAFVTVMDYFRGMNGLTPLEICLSGALDGLPSVSVTWAATEAVAGHVLAEDICLAQAMPPATEALRAGFAVAALDLLGAGTGSPVPVGNPVRVVPGASLPPGTDAVLPEDGTEIVGGLAEAIRPVSPGEGVRRPGHDGRAGDLMIAAGTRLTPRHILIAAQAGIARVGIRQPRVAIALDDPAQSAFARGWVLAIGARVVDGPADLTLRTGSAHVPRLALAPAETAWLGRLGDALELTVPARFDGMVAACLGLALPALAQLAGTRAALRSRPLARKITSSVGVSDLVLLAEDAGQWLPQPAGTVFLSALATATAFAILPPDSEGLPAGTTLAATPIDLPFG